MVGQCVVNGVVNVVRVCGQLDELLGSAVMLAPLKVHDAAAQSAVGRILVAGAQCGVDIQAACVGLGAILRKNELAGHLRHELCMHACAVLPSVDVDGFLARRSGLGRGDESVLLHAVDDVLLANASPLGVADRVVG